MNTYGYPIPVGILDPNSCYSLNHEVIPPNSRCTHRFTSEAGGGHMCSLTKGHDGCHVSHQNGVVTAYGWGSNEYPPELRVSEGL